MKICIVRNESLNLASGAEGSAVLDIEKEFGAVLILYSQTVGPENRSNNCKRRYLILAKFRVAYEWNELKHYLSPFRRIKHLPCWEML